MKRILNITIALLALCFPLFAQNIGSWDEIAKNSFGELIALSMHRNELGCFRADSLINTFTDNALGAKISLENPLKPVIEDPDRIHLLDTGTRKIITWDRFLNLHTITPLHEDILSPSAFTVSSEHDWLIYDEFREQVVQIHSGEIYPQVWGSKNFAPDIELFSIKDMILIHEKSKNKLIICDNIGNALNEFGIPDSISVSRLFPLTEQGFILTSNNSIFLWKPHSDLLRYLGDIEHVIYVDQPSTSAYRVITRDGAIHYLP